MMRKILSSKRAMGAAILAALALGALIQGRAQEAVGQKAQPPSTASRAAAQNPEGVTFTIRLKDGKSQFRQGEVIALELSFSSSLPHAYKLDAATYDRGGRLEADTFHLSPRAGAVDPLREYFGSGYGSMGGLRAVPELESKPYTITLELNEWLRFERPGKYRLYVTNNRVSKMTKDRSPGLYKNTLPLTSNTIELEILTAEPEWLKQKLREATATLDETKREQGRRDACRALRFLNSEAAAREMIRRFRGTDSECQFEYYMGLIGSPHRSLVVGEMEAMLAAPEFPVTTTFINALSFIKFTLAHPEPMPPYPAGDAEKEKPWQAEMKRRRDAHREITSGYVGLLASSISTKQKEALATGLNTLLDYRENFPGAGAGVSDEQLAAALSTVFLDLPADRQYSTLLYRWKRLASPAMLPALHKIYEKPSQSGWELRDAALQRINELAPDEGRRLILEEIRSGRPRVKAHTLSLLPDETLPELDDILADQLERINSENQFEVLSLYSSLLARYATASVLPRVRAAYEEKMGKLACDIQTGVLAYFLRVDPAYGVEALERALAARKETRCYASQFSSLAGELWRPEVNEVALAHLADPSPEVMAQAADLLGRRGAAAAEQPLRNALEQWHERYAGAGEERLLAELKKAGVAVDPSMIELSLVRALASGGAWLTDAEKLGRLRQLCVTEECRREASSLISQSNDRVITIFFNPSDDRIDHISVGQYTVASLPALKEKLAQYPSGTEFIWSTSSVDEREDLRLFTDLRAYLKGRGMGLERFPTEKSAPEK